jgi:hypothetical protein
VLDVAASRLRNQRLTTARCATPVDVVSWLGAVQAQEYADAKWALALRMRRGQHDQIERAIVDGDILRTHVLRPTWHFVAPADIRWMLALTGPRIGRLLATYNRRLDLDAATLRRCQRVFVRMLRGGGQLTRQELKTGLTRAGIRADGTLRLGNIVMQAELDAVICSGGRRGKQFTYALLDERVPATRTRSRDWALAELARRYFTGHGPAQLHDFVWWSGLTVGDARAALAMVEQELACDVIAGRTYWYASGGRAAAPGTAFLLPLYDEYLIAYKDRSAAIDTTRTHRVTPPDPFSAAVVLGGKAVGRWRRVVRADTVAVRVTPLVALAPHEKAAVAAAAAAYAGFHERRLELSWG